jgi:serpin B
MRKIITLAVPGFTAILAWGMYSVVAPDASGRRNSMNQQSAEAARSGNSGQPAIAAHALSDFGLKLVADVADHNRQKNVFVSPLSVFFALAMTEGGSRGQTQAAMRTSLAIPSTTGEDELHQSASALLKSLNAQKGVQLSIANALWSDPRAPLAHRFVDRCRTFYQADVTTLKLDSPSAADTINNWVKQKTQGKIPTIVTPDALRGSPAVLTNAVYFKGGWEYTFSKDETREGDFHLANSNVAKPKAAGGPAAPGPKGSMNEGSMKDGSMKDSSMKEDSIKKVPFMHRSLIPHAYRSGPGFEVAALPYANSNTVLYAILPAPGTAPEDALAKVSVPDLLSSYQTPDLDLKLPRFTLDFTTSLKDSLERLGMAPAFHANGDFAPLGSPEFYIGDVLHKTRLEVDEEGTVAAAATAVIMVGSAMLPPTPKKTLVFDRPFALLLCDSQTGAILFAGVIYDPR